MGLYSVNGGALGVYDKYGNPLIAFNRNGEALNADGPVDPPETVNMGLAVNEFPDRMGQWWGQLEDAATTPARVLIAGNSLSAGYSASTTGAVDHTQFRANGWLMKMRATVASRLGLGGEGAIAFSDPRVTTSGSPLRLSSYGPGLYAYRLSSGKSITVTAVSGTRIGLMWRHEVGATQPPSVTVDGGAPWVPSATGTTTGQYVTDYLTGLADTTHTVVITGPAAGQFDVSCLIVGSLDTISRLSAPGGYVYDSFPNNVDTHANEAEVLKVTLDALDINLLGLAFGQNEATYQQSLGTAFTPAALAARYTRILNYQINTRGESAVIIAGPARSGVTGDSTMDNYWDALRDVAASYPARCDFIDFRTVTGDAYVSGDFWDTVHPKIAMHATMATVGQDSLFPVGTALAARVLNAA